MGEPGYFEEGWTAKDVLAHVAAWLAEGVLALEQLRAGTFAGGEMDVDAMNATFLAANRDEALEVVMVEGHASRHRLLEELQALAQVGHQVSDEAGRWLRKAGPDHYAEHLPRLREWVDRLRR